MQRLIYSLELELDPGPGPQRTFLICPLDCVGNTLHSYVLGKPRMIDVRSGDTVQHARGRWKVIGVKAWRETYFPDGEPHLRMAIWCSGDTDFVDSYIPVAIGRWTPMYLLPPGLVCFNTRPSPRGNGYA